MVKLSRPIVLGIDVLVSKQTVKYKHWLAGIDCLIICFIGGLEICFSLVPLPSAVIHRIGGLEIICFGSSVGRTGGTTLESAVQFRPEAMQVVQMVSRTVRVAILSAEIVMADNLRVRASSLAVIWSLTQVWLKGAVR